MKSSGNRSALRLTAWFRTLVVAPYSTARSESKMTLSPRTLRMHLSNGTRADLAESSFFMSHPINKMRESPHTARAIGRRARRQPRVVAEQDAEAVTQVLARFVGDECEVRGHGRFKK